MEHEKRAENHCLPPPEPYPWLVYFDGNCEENNQVFCSISDETKTYSRNIPEFQTANLERVHDDGWCLLSNKDRRTVVSQYFLWNPCSLEKIMLPPVTSCGIQHFILMSSPTAVDQVCSIFLFSWMEPVIFYIQLGDTQWAKVYYNEDLRRISLKPDSFVHLTNPVCCNGRLYAESVCEGILLVIEKDGFRGLKLKSTNVLVPRVQVPHFRLPIRIMLSESNKELFYIEIVVDSDQIIADRRQVIAIGVHRLDFSKMEWEKVESLKDKVFFISGRDDNFIACEAKNPEIDGGRIYLVLGSNNFVFIYNIEDKSLVISQPFLNLPKKRNGRARWLPSMPAIRMTNSLMTIEDQIQENQECGIIHCKEIRIGDMDSSQAYPFHLGMVDAIAGHINILDYLHFRASSRLFRSIAPPVEWRSTMSRWDESSLTPLFVCFEKDRTLTLVHPKHGLKYKYNINLPRELLPECTILYSKDGWLLVVSNTNSLFFFNPFSKEVRPLAFGPRTVRNVRCIGFSHTPSSPECIIVNLINNGYTMTSYVVRPGEEEWNQYSFVSDNDSLLNNISPAWHKGAFFLCVFGMLGVFQIYEDHKANWKVLRKPYARCTNYYKSFLIECDGNLLSVFEGHFGKWVRVFKLDESTMTWIKVETLGNHMLFVGNTSFSAIANIPGMENKIYFPRFYRHNIVFYSLDTKKYHTFDDKEEVVNFHLTREQLNSGWIEPRWH